MSAWQVVDTKKGRQQAKKAQQALSNMPLKPADALWDEIEKQNKESAMTSGPQSWRAALEGFSIDKHPITNGSSRKIKRAPEAADAQQHDEEATMEKQANKDDPYAGPCFIIVERPIKKIQIKASPEVGEEDKEVTKDEDIQKKEDVGDGEDVEKDVQKMEVEFHLSLIHI